MISMLIENNLPQHPLSSLPNEVLCRVVSCLDLQDVHHLSLASKSLCVFFQEKFYSSTSFHANIKKKSTALSRPICLAYKQRYQQFLDGYAHITLIAGLVALTVFSGMSLYLSLSCVDGLEREAALSDLRWKTWSVFKQTGGPMIGLWALVALLDETGFHQMIRRIIRGVCQVRVAVQYAKLFAHRNKCD